MKFTARLPPADDLESFNPAMQKPVLIIQLRRLGDLILTFPLLLALQKHYADSPAHIVAHPAFFKPLMQFAPKAVFFPPTALADLVWEDYEAVFNFGAGKEAAKFTGAVRADKKFGEILKDGQTHIEGFWQLYRAALTQNNHHNLFHWADLNRLDLTGPESWPGHRLRPIPDTGRIGLFIGASEIAKRPKPPFWAALARRLLAVGLKPVLLGGSAETEAGALIAAKAGLEKANFSGKTSLAQLTHIISTLDLLITPDTGPMHLADWLGTRVLNLSMGNVNVNETGPLAPGQIILRPSMSCYGCWSCSRERLFCQQAFTPAAVCQTTRAILDYKVEELPLMRGLNLLRSAHDGRGLHKLEKLGHHAGTVSHTLDWFWKETFLYLYSKNDISRQQAFMAREHLERFNPALLPNMRETLGEIMKKVIFGLGRGEPLPASFWQNQPRHSRLFAGWLQMRLENANYSKTCMDETMEQLGFMAHLLAPEA